MAKTPNIRFKGFTDDWEQRKLGEVADGFDYGLNAAATNYDGKNKYVRITDIDDETHLFKMDELTSPDIDITIADQYKLSEGDVLFARTGASVGKTYKYKSSDGDAYFAGFLIRARIKPEYDAEFVFQNTLTDKYDRFIRVTSQRSGQPGVNAQEYQNFDILTPKLDEQKRIGVLFKNLDNLITLHQRKCDETKKLKKYMLQKMFPKKGEKNPEIRFKGFTNDWEQRKLGEVADGFDYGLNAAATNYDGKNKYVRITDIDDETHLFKMDELTSPDIDITIADQYKLSEGDVLFARTGASVGKTYKYKSSDGDAYFAGFLIRARIKPEYDAEFVFQNTLTDKYDRFIRVTSQRSGQPGVNAQEYQNFDILTPKLDEQKRIGVLFKNLDNLITLHQRKCDETKKLKKYMLQKMFPKKGEKNPEIRFKGFTNDWEQRKLGEEAIEILAGGDIDKEKVIEEGKYPIYANALTNDGIVGYYNDYYRVKAPAVTVTGRGEVGHAQARMTDFTPVVRLLAIRSNHDCYFLENAINNHKVVVESTGVPQLTVPQLSSYDIFFPSSIEEEKKIGEYFHDLDNLITLHQRKCDILKEVKNYMLQNMFL